MSERSDRFIAGAGVLTVANFGARLAAFISLPLLTRWLGAEAYGQAALVTTAIGIASVIALMGMDISYARAWHDSTLAPREIVEQCSWRLVLGASIVLSVIASAAWVVLSQFLRADSSWWWAVGLGVLLAGPGSMSQMRARLHRRFGRLALAVFAGALLGVLCSVAIGYFRRSDPLALIVGVIITFIVPLAALGIPRITSGHTASDPRLWWSILRVGIPALVTAPLYWMVTSIDRWFLAIYRSLDEAGIYSLATMVGMAGTNVVTAVMAVTLPEVARNADLPSGGGVNARLVYRGAIAIFLGWLALAVAGADLIRLLGAPEFHAAARYVVFIAAGIAFYGWSQLGGALLMARRRLIWSAVSWGVVAAASIALNLYAVPRWGAMGAALVQMTSFAAVAILTSLAVIRFAPVPLPWARAAAGSLIILATAALMHRSWNEAPAVSLSLKLAPAMLLAAIAAFVMDPSLLPRRKAMD